MYVREIEISRGYEEEASSKSSCVLLMCKNAARVSDFVSKNILCANCCIAVSKLSVGTTSRLGPQIYLSLYTKVS